MLHDLIHVRNIKMLISNKLITEQWLSEAAEFGRKENYLSYFSSCCD